MDKIVIALNLVIDYIDQYEIIDEKDISDYLFHTGFDDHEIRHVLTLLDMRKYTMSDGIRYFTKSERKVLTDSAMCYLQKLMILGILDALALEEIIDTAMEAEGFNVDIEQIKSFTLLTLMDKRTSGYAESSNDDEYSH